MALAGPSSATRDGERVGTPTSDEMMTVAASRALRDGAVCFVGIGLPSTAANLARATHAPNLVLVYESGTIGAKPYRLPLSVGDSVLAETADTIVPMAEISITGYRRAGSTSGSSRPPRWTASPT